MLLTNCMLDLMILNFLFQHLASFEQTHKPKRHSGFFLIKFRLTCNTQPDKPEHPGVTIGLLPYSRHRCEEVRCNMCHSKIVRRGSVAAVYVQHWLMTVWYVCYSSQHRLRVLNTSVSQVQQQPSWVQPHAQAVQHKLQMT